MTTQQLHTPLTTWKMDSNPLSNHKKISRLSILQGAHEMFRSPFAAGGTRQVLYQNLFQHCCTIEYIRGEEEENTYFSN